MITNSTKRKAPMIIASKFHTISSKAVISSEKASLKK
jgi:hypothetical protein